MNRRKSRTVPGVFGVLAVLLSAALLGGCGSSTNQQVPPASGAATGGAATLVGINNCTTCHTMQTADWLTTRHANAESGLSSAGSPSLGGSYTPAACGQCHDPDTDSSRIIASGVIGSVARPIIGCEACHGGGSLHNGSGPISLLSGTYNPGVSTYGTGTVMVSGQFQMCTNCHELLDSTGTTTVASPAHATIAPTGPSYYITDTHFATPSAYTADGKSTIPITGYAMDFTSATVCTDCHRPHKTADINRDWAASKHGDRAVTAKNKYDAWNHYNWSCNGTDNLTCGPTSTSVVPYINDRRYCQRCHTKTGFAAYMDAIRSGNITRANNLHAGLASAVTFTYGWKPEMLECLGCHTNNRGTLRTPGAYVATYDYRVLRPTDPTGTLATIFASAQFQYPEASSSDICIPCHGGRTNGDSIKHLNTGQTTTVDFGQMFYSDAHDFPSAAVMFTAIGYEYAGRDYTNPSSYRHDRIGTLAVPNTGTGGPCVGCHMFRSGNTPSHLFEAVSTSSSGTVLNVSSPVCYNCHAGSSTELANMAETEREAFLDSLKALSYYVTTAGLTHPLVTAGSTTASYFSAGDSDKTGNTTAKNNLGAAFNVKSLGNDGGAYVHNSKYVKRLIYDSIDWLDDNNMNYTVGQNLCSVCQLTCTGSGVDAGAWCPNAMSYLLPNGVAAGAPSERP